MARISSRPPRKQSSAAATSALAVHWDVVLDATKSNKQRIAALTALGWNVAADKQKMRSVLAIVQDPAGPIDLRLSALGAVQSATFDPNRFAVFRPDYLRTLRAVSSDPDPELRQRALGMLAREHDAPTQEVLLAGLNDPGQALVSPEKALQLLGYDVHSGAYPVARAIVRDPPNEVARREALRLLAADGSSVPMFETILMDKAEPTEIRQLSASALHNLAPERLQACARTITLDGSENADIRSIGLTALTHFGDSAAIRQDETLNAYVTKLGEDASVGESTLKLAAQQYVSKRLR